MSTHTPGPWEIADLAHGLIVRTESLRKSKYGASRYAAIGGFDRSDLQQFAEALANARLIAAAPDLLEALQLFIQYEEEAERGDDVSMMLTYAELRKAAHGAIAKVTGVQS